VTVFFPRAALLIRSFSGYPDEDSGTERTGGVYRASPGQLLPELENSNQLSLRHRANHRINIERTRNNHAALSQAGLHARRNVYDLGLLLSLQFFPPRNSAAEFGWHDIRSGVDGTAGDAIMQQLSRPVLG
jgi:hypothetical protein